MYSQFNRIQNKSFSLKPDSGLLYGHFIERPNRFIVLCSLHGKKISAFLPNPGRLWELLFPGSILILKTSQRNSVKRKTGHTVIGVLHEGVPIMLDTHENNRVASWLVETGRIPGLEKFRVKKREVTCGKSRFDFLLRDERGDYYLEVKSCTLFRGKLAMFPDSPSERASRHVNELCRLAESGFRCGVLFVVHSHTPQYFLPEYHTDPDFASNLKGASPLLDIIPVSVRWEENLLLSKKGRILSIPWNILEAEGNNRGSYLSIMEMKEDHVIAVGNLGDIFFKKGFYIYVGSGMGNLEQRMNRHRRKRKNRHWHIDYLLEYAKLLNILPVRSSNRLECKIASAIRKITDSRILSFGSSDCSCDSHLFYSSQNPLNSEDFVDVLLYYRMSRLETMLTGS
jgi:sugar fermentation stimulation protein A